jgi:hypothetical protein
MESIVERIKIFNDSMHIYPIWEINLRQFDIEFNIPLFLFPQSKIKLQPMRYYFSKLISSFNKIKKNFLPTEVFHI